MRSVDKVNSEYLANLDLEMPAPVQLKSVHCCISICSHN